MIIEDIFEEYYQKKDGTEISIEQMKLDMGDLSERIVLYGAGSSGIAFLYCLRGVGIEPKFFADGNPNKWGSLCEGIEIIDYKDIVPRLGKNALVIVTINTDGVRYCKSFDEALRAGGHGGVHNNLREAGCKNVIDYTYFRRCRDLFAGDRYNLPSCSDVRCMERNKDKICDAYKLLSDEKSREIYEKLVRFRLLDDTIKIPTTSQDKQYFEYDYFPKREDEIFVDCGAYNGISLRAFLKENNGRIKKYYGLEPDAANYEKLKEYIAKLPADIRDKTKIYGKCAYDDTGYLNLYALSGPGSFIADIGTQSTEGIMIDDMVDSEGATFIKMNIEGSELAALRGAKTVISDFKPRLAIAGYHKTWDLWEVPFLIHEYNKEYSLHLRSYMNNISFVYYAA